MGSDRRTYYLTNFPSTVCLVSGGHTKGSHWGMAFSANYHSTNLVNWVRKLPVRDAHGNLRPATQLTVSKARSCHAIWDAEFAMCICHRRVAQE